MVVEIDQSGRVEDLTMNTTVAYSNGHRKAIFVSAGIKRTVVRILKSNPSISVDFAPFFFALLVFLLLKKEKLKSILIDEEYTGKDTFITETLKVLFRKEGVSGPQIRFGRIGKHSNAHALALKTHRGKGHGATKIDLEEILKYIAKKQAGSKRRTHRVSR
ncbi:MAG: hypothetical protein AAB506_01395 [Patescibacteria group bacterium]